MFSFKATRVVLDLCATFCWKTSQFSATRGQVAPILTVQINNLATRIQRHAVHGVCDALLCKEEKKTNTQVNERQQQDGERPEAPAAAPAAAPLVATRLDDAPLGHASASHPTDGASSSCNISVAALKRRSRGGGGGGGGAGGGGGRRRAR